MSLETCGNCGCSFLTEADPYMIIPIEDYKLICWGCVSNKSKKLQKALGIANEAIDCIASNNSEYLWTCGTLEQKNHKYKGLDEKDICRQAKQQIEEILKGE